MWLLLTLQGQEDFGGKDHTTFSIDPKSMKYRYIDFPLNFDVNISSYVLRFLGQHCFRQWLGARSATNHYLKQCWLRFMRIFLCHQATVSTVSHWQHIITTYFRNVEDYYRFYHSIYKKQFIVKLYHIKKYSQLTASSHAIGQLWVISCQTGNSN